MKLGNDIHIAAKKQGESYWKIVVQKSEFWEEKIKTAKRCCGIDDGELLYYKRLSMSPGITGSTKLRKERMSTWMQKIGKWYPFIVKSARRNFESQDLAGVVRKLVMINS